MPGVSLAKKLLGKKKKPIEFVGYRIHELAGSASSRSIAINGLTGGLASAPAENDTVLIWFASVDGGNNDIDLSVTGYTELCDLYANDNDDAQLGVYWKRMTSSPDTTATISSTGHADNAAVVIVTVWRNVHPTNPIDVTTTTATGANSAYSNPPSITPVTQGAVIVAGGCTAYGFPISDVTYNTPAGYDWWQKGYSDDNNDVQLGVGYKFWTSGAFDPPNHTQVDGDNAANSWCAATVALRPE